MDLFEAVRSRQEELRVPGVAVGVLQNGEERHEGFGITSVENPLDVTPETRFQIGSISKTFTGSVVMYLVAQGSRTRAAGRATTSTTRAGGTTPSHATSSACGRCPS